MAGEVMLENGFCARFQSHMLKLVGPVFADGSSVAAYALDAAVAAYGALLFGTFNWTPEEAVEAEIENWGD